MSARLLAWSKPRSWSTCCADRSVATRWPPARAAPRARHPRTSMPRWCPLWGDWYAPAVRRHPRSHRNSSVSLGHLSRASRSHPCPTGHGSSGTSSLLGRGSTSPARRRSARPCGPSTGVWPDPHRCCRPRCLTQVAQFGAAGSDRGWAGQGPVDLSCDVALAAVGDLPTGEALGGAAYDVCRVALGIPSVQVRLDLVDADARDRGVTADVIGEPRQGVVVGRSRRCALTAWVSRAANRPHRPR